jgi:hypothetical protein
VGVLVDVEVEVDGQRCFVRRIGDWDYVGVLVLLDFALVEVVVQKCFVRRIRS